MSGITSSVLALWPLNEGEGRKCWAPLRPRGIHGETCLMHPIHYPFNQHYCVWDVTCIYRPLLKNIAACTELSGNEPEGQVDVDRMSASE